MAVTLGSNVFSLRAIRELATGVSASNRNAERLGSGMRINRASDDAAGLAISSSLDARSRVYGQAILNLNDGISAIAIAEGGVQELGGVVGRLRELASSAANGTFSRTQRLSLDAEAHELVKEYNRITQTTKFNDRSLLGGIREFVLQLGYGNDGTLNFGLGQQLVRKEATGAYSTTTNGTSTYNVQNMTTGDFDGDGNLDYVVLSNNSLNATRFKTFLGNGDGTFSTIEMIVATAPDYTGIAAGDFDGDGDVDIGIGTGELAGSAIQLYTNDGQANFTAGNAIVSAIAVEELAFKDLNGDGKLDLVANRTAGGQIQVYMGNGNGTFGALSSYDTANESNHFRIGDFTGDGIDDILVSNVAASASNTIQLLVGNSNGTFGAAQSIVQASGASTGGDIEIGDINHDGLPDFVHAESNGDLYTYLNNGNGTFGRTRVQNFSGITDVSLVDHNGDGVLDIIAASNSGNAIYTMWGNGDGYFSTNGSTTSSAAGISAITTGDFNNDGVVDTLDLRSGTTLARTRLSQTQDVTTIGRLDLTTMEGALSALNTLESIFQKVSKEVGDLGSAQSRMLSALNTLRASQENYIQAAGRIKDADVATETAEYVKNQIRTQVASSVLGQANLAPALALRLLQN